MALNFDNKIPEWKNEGIEPSEDLKQKGFVGGYKPPASVFNWFWSKVQKCIAELQNKISIEVDDIRNCINDTSDEVSAVENKLTLADMNLINQLAEIENYADTISGNLDDEMVKRTAADEEIKTTINSNVAVLQGRINDISGLLNTKLAIQKGTTYSLPQEYVVKGSSENIVKVAEIELDTIPDCVGTELYVSAGHNTTSSNTRATDCYKITLLISGPIIKNVTGNGIYNHLKSEILSSTTTNNTINAVKIIKDESKAYICLNLAMLSASSTADWSNYSITVNIINTINDAVNIIECEYIGSSDLTELVSYPVVEN